MRHDEAPITRKWCMSQYNIWYCLPVRHEEAPIARRWCISWKASSYMMTISSVSTYITHVHTTYGYITYMRTCIHSYSLGIVVT